MRRVSGSTTTHRPGFTSACSQRFFLLSFVLSFLLNNIVHDFTIKMFSISLLIYPRIPAGASGIDIRQQGHLGRKKVFVNKISISINSVLNVSTVLSRENLVENLLLYCIDISLSICFWHQGHLCWIFNFSSGQQLHCSEGR